MVRFPLSAMREEWVCKGMIEFRSDNVKTANRKEAARSAHPDAVPVPFPNSLVNGEQTRRDGADCGSRLRGVAACKLTSGQSWRMSPPSQAETRVSSVQKAGYSFVTARHLKS